MSDNSGHSMRRILTRWPLSAAATKEIPQTWPAIEHSPRSGGELPAPGCRFGSLATEIIIRGEQGGSPFQLRSDSSFIFKSTAT
jgi:hypothetical protein